MIMNLSTIIYLMQIKIKPKSKTKKGMFASIYAFRGSYLNGCGGASVRLARAPLLGVAREETLRCAQQELLQLNKMFRIDQKII